MFVFVNVNPRGKRTGDCVIRATALALGIDWVTASDLLYDEARMIGCEMSCLGCYSQLFAAIGMDKRAAHGKTVQEIADEHDRQTVIIRIRGHLTCAIDGRVNDIWDCADEVADCYWVVE